jgi:hypothetical protein
LNGHWYFIFDMKDGYGTVDQIGPIKNYTMDLILQYVVRNLMGTWWRSLFLDITLFILHFMWNTLHIDISRSHLFFMTWLLFCWSFPGPTVNFLWKVKPHAKKISTIIKLTSLSHANIKIWYLTTTTKTSVISKAKYNLIGHVQQYFCSNR